MFVEHLVEISNQWPEEKIGLVIIVGFHRFFLQAKIAKQVFFCIDCDTHLNFTAFWSIISLNDWKKMPSNKYGDFAVGKQMKEDSL